MLVARRYTSARWQIQPDWDSALLGPDGLRLAEWIERGQAAVVKQGTHRTVYRVALPDRSFYLKHYHGRTIVDRGKQLVRSSSGRREFFKTQEAARRGLPVALPLAVGEIRRVGLVAQSYYICREIPGGQPLDEFLFHDLPMHPLRRQALLRRAVAQALAELCAAMHKAGVWQNDMHLGNILIRLEAQAESDANPRIPGVELFLIDLPGVRFSSPLGWARSRDSLAMLFAGLRERTSRTDRWRFWRGYLQARPQLIPNSESDPDPLRSALRDIDAAAWRHARRVVASRDKRCLRSNRDFHRQRLAEGKAYAVADFPRPLLAALAADPEQPIRESRHAPIKISHSSAVVKTELTLAGGPVAVAYKRSRVKTPSKRLLAPLRRSRALRGWVLGHALLQRGIATARPLCVFEPDRGRDAWLATEWIEGAENLHLYLWNLARRPLGERETRAARCAAALGALIGRMHGWRIAHRDLKACNLVAAERGEDVRTLLIDLDGVERKRKLTLASRVRDLARLATSMSMHAWLSAPFRLRFFRSYLRSLHFGARPDSGELKQLWRAVAAASESRRTRMIKTGKRVA